MILPPSSLPIRLSSWPDETAQTVRTAWSEFCERAGEDASAGALDDDLLDSLGSVWASSRFVRESCVREPSILFDLSASGDLLSDAVRSRYRQRLVESGWVDVQTLMRALRRFRRREMVRIAWRDIAGWADLAETLEDLSALAEVCLQTALDDLFDRLCERHGTPRLSDGEPQKPVVLGMGKLGAWELNFSSDIDLVFAYPEEGVLSDRRGTTYGEFFTRLCRNLVKVIDSATEDGFVFRVDTRLRPFGKSGPLVMSFEAMEAYYQGQAREWERYAMIKARPVAGDPLSGKRLQELLHPFVYRRYLDFRALGELRNLKAQITRELERKDRVDNIKLGPGGIREIEFIGQAFQLIRGGRNVALQERRIQKVLAVLAAQSLLPAAVVDKLIAGYRQLRRIENRLQEYADAQVHDLPSQAVERERLAVSLGYPGWPSFARSLDRIRVHVHTVFQQVFESPQSDAQNGDSDRLWAVDSADDQRVAAAAALGYKAPESVIKILSDFRNTHVIRKLTAQGAEYLDRLMPLVLGAAAHSENPEVSLKRVLGLIEAVASRTAYLSLLVENPLALSQLVKLASASSWIIAHIAKAPVLLDELLDPRALYAPLTREALVQDLERRLSVIDPDDLEQLMIELRQFKQAQVLRVAAADIMEIIPVMVVSDYLTDIAEVILDRVIKQVWGLLSKKHGVPPGCCDDTVSNFGVIAYGKLGGIELGYGSDLDLVFLYDAPAVDGSTGGDKPIGSAQFFARLGQRIIHVLTANLLSGVLYEVDMRLRPSGNAGLLVSRLDAFETYQKNDAWTWEHQALVRARFVAGDDGIKERFQRVRTDILTQPRDAESVRDQVRGMREKMRDTLAKNEPGLFDLKQGQGGIADIEFLVQYGVLTGASEHPELVRFSDNVRLLDGLKTSGFINEADADLLTDAYCLYRNLGHRAALQERPALVPAESVEPHRTHTWHIWERIMVSPAG